MLKQGLSREQIIACYEIEEARVEYLHIVLNECRDKLAHVELERDCLRAKVATLTAGVYVPAQPIYPADADNSDEGLEPFNHNLVR